MEAGQRFQIALQISGHHDCAPAEFPGDDAAGFDMTVEGGTRDTGEFEHLPN